MAARKSKAEKARPQDLGPPRSGTNERKAREAIEDETARLAQELAATREYLQSVNEQQEAANEELATLNDELRNRNEELRRSNDDFVNLLASVQLPIVMLGSDFRIRRWTPMAEKLFNVTAADMGRRISEVRLGIALPQLEEMLAEVMETASVKETEVRDKDGRWYVLRLRPYRTLDNRIDGAVLVLLDVDVLKRSQDTLRRQDELLDQAHEAIFIWEIDGGITY